MICFVGLGCFWLLVLPLLMWIHLFGFSFVVLMCCDVAGLGGHC